MATPQTFMGWFRQEMHAAGVAFALTSGQACVYYGIQQTTKDSDWIIEPNDLTTLREMLETTDAARKTRVSYRSICGAPLEADFLGHGWTSHIVITDADGDEHHVDLFGKAPRVSRVERDPTQPDYASRLVVAQMKKTDREKDWPIVFGLGRQAFEGGDVRGVLHGQDAEWLSQVWDAVPDDARGELIRERPLLGLLDVRAKGLRRALMLEKHLWSEVNRRRYRIYQQAWKEFFRLWRREPEFQWPTDTPFSDQCRRLSEAVRQYALPPSPLNDDARRDALFAAKADVMEVFAATDEELDEINPPLEVLLP